MEDRDDVRYIKANPEFNKKLNELIRLQKGEPAPEDTLWETIDFDKSLEETGFPPEELKVRLAILGELIFHQIANGAKYSKEELARLCEMKWQNLQKEKED